MVTVMASSISEASPCTPSPGAAEANSVRAAGGATAESCEISAADVSAVYQFVARRVANPADAADIAQQALLVGCAKRLTHRGGPLSAWLIVIARHLVVDHFRSAHRFQFLDVEALSETDWALQSPPAVYENRERLMRWLDCVARRLPPVEQIAVLLADVYAYRDRDSAAVVRMSVPSFKLLLHEARARLHPFVDRDGGKDAETGRGKPAGDSPGRTCVTCRLGSRELVALRDRLIEGLGL
jgi:DNA-directed RNA polymerase specialized sigma24 family protein